MNTARLLLGALITMATASAASAEMQVIESNVTEYQVGARFPDGWTPQIKPGGLVRVLLLPSNQTKTFQGPPATSEPGGVRGGPLK